MFAMLLGALPRPPDALDDDAAVRFALEAQEAAGLEPLSDGGLRRGDALDPVGNANESRTLGARTVESWRFAASTSDRAVKQRLPGPYSAARAHEAGRRDRARVTLDLAAVLHEQVTALAAAGCPLVEIEEPLAIQIGDDDAERRLFADAHRRLTGDSPATHLSLVLSGGNVDTAGSATFLDAAYASYAVDLIAGPDNWRFVVDVPGDRGIVCGALSPEPRSDDAKELLVWAAQYAASTGGRGLDRVGLANAPGLDKQDWSVVQRKLARLGEAVQIAALGGEDLAGRMDPRAVDIRSAALGRYEPRRPR
jgi:methionine synthase II (cobalamin-independent)